MDPLELTRKERASVFQDAIIVMTIHSITIYMMARYFMDTLSFTPPKDFAIMVPRIISCFYMHIRMEGELQNAIKTMKYVINHPNNFRRILSDEDEDALNIYEKREGLTLRVTYAFFLGLF